MRIKGYIFDYGGTLDTRGNHWGKVLWHAYERHGVPITENNFRDAYVFTERLLARERIIMPDFTFHRTLQTKLRLQMEYLHDNGLWNETKDVMDFIGKRMLDDIYGEVVKTQEESRRVLTLLAKEKPLVLVSNFYGNVNVVLKEFNLADLFLKVVESSVVGIRKPDPRIFTIGVEALSPLKAEEILVVGDSMDKDIIPAHSIGCKTAWYKGEPWKNDPDDTSAADIIIEQLKDLI